MSGDGRHRVFRFGVFEASEITGELRKNGTRIKLHSQPFQVLVMLLERPREVVTREQMRRRLWGEDTFVDFDHGLNTAINKIRDALNDAASQPRYVETVSGKGYRFIAPVAQSPAKVEVNEALASAEDVPAPTPSTVLAAPHELPEASRGLIRSLLLLMQGMYLAFCVGALSNMPEIHEIFFGEIFSDAKLLPPAALMAVLVTTATVLIPVRLYLLAAVAFDHRQLPAKFGKLFPVLLVLDLLWALSPFLLVHHLSTGLALGMSAALLYVPFAQRSLILMYARGR